MKINDTPTSIARSSTVTKDTGFQIKSSSKAFEILSSGLYKNKIRAIVRELATNAADSHIAAGKRTLPFLVHLPTMIEPFFSIKDNGVGLTPEQIMTTYTVYFASDKTHSDDYTGCLGLGSKSPFSYTDSFTVTSVTDGMKRVYTAFVDDGTPSINMIGEEATTDPTGVEVKLAVKPADFGNFKREAISVYEYFTPRPFMPGVTVSDYDDLTAAIEDPQFKILVDGRSTSTVLMGNVGYDFDLNDLVGHGPLSETEQIVLRNIGPIFNVNVGDVDFVASRESLQFTARTVATIRRLLKHVVDTIKSKVETAVAQAKTKWDARIAFHGLCRNYWVSQIIGHEFLWKGQIISETIIVDKGFCREFAVGNRHHRRDSKVVVYTSIAKMIKAEPNAMIFINDLKTGFNNRIIDFLGPIKNRLQHNKSNEKISLYMFHASHPGTMKFLEDEGLLEVVKKVSELPARIFERAPRRPTPKLLRLSGSATSMTDMWMEEIRHTIEDGGIYVEVSGYDWKAGQLSDGYDSKGLFAEPQKLQKILYDTNAFLGQPVFGVRAGSMKLVAAAGKKWVRLDVALRAKVKEAKSVAADYAKHVALTKLDDKFHQFQSIPAEIFATRSPLRKLLNLAKALKDRDGLVVESYIKTCDLIGIELSGEVRAGDTIKQLCKSCEERYPLLMLITIRGYTWNQDEKQVQAVIDYVNMVDRRRPVVRSAEASVCLSI